MGTSYLYNSQSVAFGITEEACRQLQSLIQYLWTIGSFFISISNHLKKYAYIFLYNFFLLQKRLFLIKVEKDQGVWIGEKWNNVLQYFIRVSMSWCFGIWMAMFLKALYNINRVFKSAHIYYQCIFIPTYSIHPTANFSFDM